jgi:hypothetical protein
MFIMPSILAANLDPDFLAGYIYGSGEQATGKGVM